MAYAIFWESSSDTYRGSPDVYQELKSAASIARDVSQFSKIVIRNLPSHDDTVIVGNKKAHCLRAMLVSGVRVIAVKGSF